MIKYSNLNFPEDGHPMWLSINLQRVDQWSMIFQLQNLSNKAVEPIYCDWLFIGDRFLSVANTETQKRLSGFISEAKFVVINDLPHAMENQHCWIKEGLPEWLPKREYHLVTNSQTKFKEKKYLKVHYYDFLFNRTKAYYSGFPFQNSPWYYAGRENYRAPLVKDNSDRKSKIFLAPCRLYLDQNRTLYRKQLFDIMQGFTEDGYRSGPGRVKNGSWDKELTGAYLVSTSDDPLINFHELGWSYNPKAQEVMINLEALTKWKGSRWGGYNPIHNFYYDDTYISIYGETIETGEMVVITEKTYDPLIKGHFILPFGTSGLIACIKKIGFELPSFIDYSYDLIEDSSLRFECYAKEIQRVMKFSTHRWRQLWKENLELLQRNQRLFYLKDYNRISNLFPEN